MARSHRRGVASPDAVIEAVDRHAPALERAIASRAAKYAAEFQRTVHRLETLAGYMEMYTAQADWLESFPHGVSKPVPLTVPTGRGHRVHVSRLLAALHQVEIDHRLIARAATSGPKRHGRRGAAPSMAGLADAGVSARDVALELGVSSEVAWAILNGHRPAPAGLQQALDRLVGADVAHLVLDGIPQHPRKHAPISPALKALKDAGARSEDVARLMGVQPNTVNVQLRGQLRISPKLAPALEQLLGRDNATRILDLVPDRRKSSSPQC